MAWVEQWPIRAADVLVSIRSNNRKTVANVSKGKQH
jgi:hypothetical protein